MTPSVSKQGVVKRYSRQLGYGVARVLPCQKDANAMLFLKSRDVCHYSPHQRSLQLLTIYIILILRIAEIN
jgi:predicted class III extradiol MEMO1 family dioxygenase